MSTTCVTPTFTEVEADYGIFPTVPPPCLPDSVTQLLELLTEDGLDLLTEASTQILLEGP